MALSYLIILLAMSFGLGGCSSTQILARGLSAAWPDIGQAMPRPVEMIIFNGHGKKLETMVPPEIAQLERKLLCNDREVYHHITDGRLIAFVASRYKNPQNITCQLQLVYRTQRHSYTLFKLAVKKFPFHQERLNVPKRHVELSPPDLARWKRDVAMQKKVYRSGVTLPYFAEDFLLPLESKVTSPYGLQRIFNDKRQSRHSGTDFRAAVGVPIPVSNRGKVVFSGDLFFNGHTVIVDHGMNIFTMYCHLSGVIAQLGAMVEKMEIIGLAGATGRVTGPHLHWGVKVDHQWINGMPFVQEGI